MKNSNYFSSNAVITYSIGKESQENHATNTFHNVWLEQTHSAHFVQITTSVDQTLLNTDAALTCLPNTQLHVKHADCLPVLLYHPFPLIGVVHAGRKGTDQFILQKLLLYLKNNFNIDNQLELWFGPAICVACYQVDKEKDLRYDLVKENTEQVRKIFSESQATITYSNRCTAHENDHYYSYRKEGKGVPMNWSGIALSS
jgi:YfiH family protein